MTELLYLEDSYRRTCDATVIAVDGDARRSELDRTVFYVQGGDRGPQGRRRHLALGR